MFPKEPCGSPTPGPQTVASVGNGVFPEAVRESEVSRLGPHPVCLVSSEARAQRQSGMEGRPRGGKEEAALCQADAPASPGMPRVAGEHQDKERERWVLP